MKYIPRVSSLTGTITYDPSEEQNMKNISISIKQETPVSHVQLNKWRISFVPLFVSTVVKFDIIYIFNHILQPYYHLHVSISVSCDCTRPLLPQEGLQWQPLLSLQAGWSFFTSLLQTSLPGVLPGTSRIRLPYWRHLPGVRSDAMTTTSFLPDLSKFTIDRERALSAWNT